MPKELAIDRIKKKKKIAKKQTLLWMSASFITLFTMIGTVLVMVLDEQAVSSAYEKFMSEDVWDRVYHMEESGFMLDNGEFVRASFTFEVGNNDNVDNLVRGKHLLKYAITDALSGLDRENLNGKRGLQKLENDIKSLLHDEYPGLGVRHVYITGIVIS